MSQRYLGGIITANPTLPTLSSASGVWTLEQDFQYSASITPQVIGSSVRLRNSATGYLSRTVASSGNRRTWSLSMWLKRGAMASGSIYSLLCTNYYNSAGGTATNINIVDGVLSWSDFATTYQYRLEPSNLLRDPSAWYHLVFVFDSNNATAADRAIIYINGVRVTSFSTATYPSSGYQTYWNAASSTTVAGGTVGDGLIGAINLVGIGGIQRGFDGYMTEVNFIDGQALTPSSFGAFDSNGIWQPLSYRGTYGTNGFYLTFADNSGATATTIGKDYSGNGNNFTPNNISVTAGTTYDWMLDTPTNSDNGGTGRGNYNTLNPAAPGTGALSNANLTSTSTTTTVYSFAGTMLLTTGKWYWEVTATTINSVNQYPFIGAYTVPIPNSLTGAVRPGADAGAGGFSLRQNGSFFYSGGTSSTITTSFTTGDVIGIAFDVDAQSVTYYKNGSSIGTQGSLGAGPWVTAISEYNGSLSNHNFGQRPFAYTPPTGFKALNTQNLPVANITNGAQYMAATTFDGVTGGGTVVNTVNSVGFQPDFVWMKARNSANNHELADSVRGTPYALFSNLTNAEVSDTRVSAFNSNGFSYGTNSNSAVTGRTSVGWQWRAGQGVTSSNTNGSITSTVSVNQTAGFSVVTYTGNGSNSTIGHGLGVAPSMVIVKLRSGAGENWNVWHTSLASTTYRILLNTAGAVDTGSPTIWSSGGINPTSTTFTVGTSSGTNGNTSTYVAYCFAAVTGYSKFGSYTGNGSADGPFVYCGFRPRWVMAKASSAATSDWVIYDTSRPTYNQSRQVLYADLSNAEASAGLALDLLSNGFKWREGGGQGNDSGTTYIFAAFAENPFQISRAR